MFTDVAPQPLRFPTRPAAQPLRSPAQLAGEHYLQLAADCGRQLSLTPALLKAKDTRIMAMCPCLPPASSGMPSPLAHHSLMRDVASASVHSVPGVRDLLHLCPPALWQRHVTVTALSTP